MLRTLFPRAHRKFLSLPLLGPITDGFDDWLAGNGFTRGSRKFCIRMLRYVDVDLRLRRVDKVAELTHSVLHDCWRTFMKSLPCHAGTVRSLERYLVASGLIANGQNEPATLPSPTWILIEEYVGHLHEVRGFAASTISHHRFTAQCFLQQLDKTGIALRDSRPSNVEAYVANAGKRLSRASLQHEIGALRGFLRFLAMDGRAPHSLASQIDTPRLYRLEQLPRALPWDTVCALLRSIDTTTAMGKRDYAIFLLIATYGLRASEVVALTLDDIRWRQGSLRIDQRKTSSPLELPLTNEVLSALVKHLKQTPTPAPYRQSVIFLRDAGIDISRATIDGWVMRVGDLLLPLVAVMGRELVSGTYIQADETPVNVQTRDGRSRNHHAYLWQYGSPGKSVIFEFRMGRGREGPLRFLGNFEGILQTDDYAAYDRVGGPKMVHAGCWSHARRKFDEAVKLNKQDLVSTRILVQMGKLFAIDAHARDEGMDHSRRHALRMERAPSVLGEIKAQIEAASRTALPSSPLGKACSYTLRLWDKLTRFLDYPELELSNNIAENSMRPVAIGRRNWTHVGHVKAGPRVAAILSIVETCRRLNIPVREYLAAVLPGLANTSIQRLPELTPTAWAAKHP